MIIIIEIISHLIFIIIIIILIILFFQNSLYPYNIIDNISNKIMAQVNDKIKRKDNNIDSQ